MGFRERFTTAVRVVKDLATGRKTPVGSPPPSSERRSGIQNVAPPPATAERPSGGAVKGHRRLARERAREEAAASAKERRSNIYKNLGYEELNQAAAEIMSDLRQIASDVPENMRLQLDAYNNLYNSLFKNHVINAQHYTETIRKNTERIASLTPLQQQVANDIERLRPSTPSEQEAKESQEIFDLCKRHGMPLQRDPSKPFPPKEKLRVIEELRSQLAAKNKPTSLKAALLSVKLGKQIEEDALLENVVRTMEDRRDNTGKEIERLTKNNAGTQESLKFVLTEMAGFVQDIDRFRNGVTEQPPVSAAA